MVMRHPKFLCPFTSLVPSPWLSTFAGLLPWGDGTFLGDVLVDEVQGEYFRFGSGSVELK